jgi:uncharacterized phage infection (PIP) family protein YhgE
MVRLAAWVVAIMVGALTIALVQSGCATQITDLKPFADATRAMDVGVASAFDARIDSLEAMRAATKAAAATAQSQGRTDAAADLTKASEEYAARVKHARNTTKYLGDATDAFVTYSGELRDIADAGRKDAAAADAYGKSIASLAGKLASLTPVPAAGVAGEAIGAIAAAAVKVASAIEIEQTRNELLAAVNARAEGADALADALVKDLEAAKRSMRGRQAAIEAASLLVSEDYEAADAFELSLRASRIQASRSIRIGLDKGMPLQPQDQKDLELLDKALASAKSWRGPYDAKVSAQQESVRSAVALMDNAIELARSWKRAHRKLPEIIDKDRRSPLDALSAIADESKKLADKLNDVRKRLKDD